MKKKKKMEKKKKKKKKKKQLVIEWVRMNKTESWFKIPMKYYQLAPSSELISLMFHGFVIISVQVPLTPIQSNANGGDTNIKRQASLRIKKMSS